MIGLDQIRKVVGEELTQLEAILADSLTSEHELLGSTISKLINLKGKRMRPLLTLLIARLYGEVRREHLVGAAIMELTHNASLVHDDILDEAYTRRSELTTMALLRSRGAVLAGDFLLTQAVSLGTSEHNYRAIDLSASTLRNLVEGELRQMRHALLLDITTEKYFEVIRLKTAYLMGSSAALGAPIEDFDKIYRFGVLLGEAFQIADDVLDYVGDRSGKARFNDLREGKITLPLLMAIEQGGEDRRVRGLVRRGEASKVAEFVFDNGGIEQSRAAVTERCDQALAILDGFDDSPVKDALRGYIEFLAQREL
ncbi:MAG: polyprenyl synthetase family protein [Rikenellaceae bacterium]